MSRGIIAAVSPEGIIGVEGRMPWHYPGDMKRFKRLTLGSTIIMGRLTWESLPKKPLADRRNVVITRRKIEGVECFPTIEAALATCQGDVWFIGGTRVFEEAMRFADVIDLVYVPDKIDASGAVYFPEISESDWEAGPLETHPDDPRLKHRVFRRRGARRAPSSPREERGERASSKKGASALSESKRHQSVTTPELPKALGPYSPGVTLGDLVFVSGQGAVNPKTGKLAGDDVESQTEQVFKNIEAILKAAGSGLDRIVRCGVFLTDMRDFPKMNAVYERMMAGNRPVRTTVQAAALPMEGLKVEIDAIAYR
jgi:2-iminobutanoate/2-iminopropanoate deaminase